VATDAEKEENTMNNKLTVDVGSMPNYDFAPGERGPKIKIKRVKVRNLDEAGSVCREFIRDHDLGGGNWIGGTIRDRHGVVGYVSYNGRLWDWDGEKYTPHQETVTV
jgi:hypothetical protein